MDPSSVWVGSSPDVAASILGLSLTICMALAILALLGVCKGVELFGALRAHPHLDALLGHGCWLEGPDLVAVDASVVAADAAPSSAPPATRAVPSSDAPVADPVLAAPGGPGLPASRLSGHLSDVARGEWVNAPAPGGVWSPWKGEVVASGRLVDLEQLAVLHPVMPREWLN